MADPVRPDPATRDLLKEAFEAGYRRGARYPLAEQFGRLPEETNTWLTAKFPPPLPDEPPDGTVCLSVNGQSLWRRCDDVDGQSRWFTAGIDSMGYAMALSHGLDPGRRLVELPDLTDGDAERTLFAVTDAILDARRARSGFAVPSADAQVISAVVRALAGRTDV